MSWRRTPPLAFVLVVIVISPFTADSLDCHPAEYEVNNECCPKCQPGSRVKTDCTEYRSTSCLPCVEGTFLDRPSGLKSCFPCSSCDSGSGLKIKTRCTITSDTVCEPLEGFYCIDSTRDGCTAAREHRRCDPGQSIQQEGTASTDTECSDCPDGTFSDGTTTQCWPHTKCEELNLQQKTAGTNSADAECETRSETGIIAAVVLSVLVLSAITGVVIFNRKWLFKVWKRRQRNPEEPHGTNPEEENFLPQPGAGAMEAAASAATGSKSEGQTSPTKPDPAAGLQASSCLLQRHHPREQEDPQNHLVMETEAVEEPHGTNPEEENFLPQPGDSNGRTHPGLKVT